MENVSIRMCVLCEYQVLSQKTVRGREISRLCSLGVVIVDFTVLQGYLAIVNRGSMSHCVLSHLQVLRMDG